MTYLCRNCVAFVAAAFAAVALFARAANAQIASPFLPYPYSTVGLSSLVNANGYDRPVAMTQSYGNGGLYYGNYGRTFQIDQQPASLAGLSYGTNGYGGARASPVLYGSSQFLGALSGYAPSVGVPLVASDSGSSTFRLGRFAPQSQLTFSTDPTTFGVVSTAGSGAGLNTGPGGGRPVTLTSLQSKFRRRRAAKLPHSVGSFDRSVQVGRQDEPAGGRSRTSGSTQKRRSRRSAKSRTRRHSGFYDCDFPTPMAGIGGYGGGAGGGRRSPMVPDYPNWDFGGPASLSGPQNGGWPPSPMMGSFNLDYGSGPMEMGPSGPGYGNGGGFGLAGGSYGIPGGGQQYGGFGNAFGGNGGYGSQQQQQFGANSNGGSVFSMDGFGADNDDIVSGPHPSGRFNATSLWRRARI